MRSPHFCAHRPPRSRPPRLRGARLAFLVAFVFALGACSQSLEPESALSQNGTTGDQLDGSGSSAQSGSSDTGADDVVVLNQSAQTAFPAGKYVSVSGNNANGGTSPTDAWRNLSHAVKQLQPGDTLWVMDGVYEENERSDAAIVVNRTGRADAWIRITAYPGATPVIRAHHANGMKVEGASYVEVSNLEFHGTYDEGNSNYSGSGINADSIYISSGTPKNHHIRILNNKVHGFGAGGIPITGSSHVEIRNNVVYNLARYEWSQHSGISILESFNMGFGNDANGYSNYITGNIVYQVENIVRDRGGRLTDGNCIIMDRTNINGYSGRTLIANNVCIDNGGRAIQIFESAHVDVVNNTTYHNMRTPEIGSSGGELGAFYSHDVVFANNLVHSANGKKPARAFDSSNIRYENNIYVADTAPEYGGNSASGDRQVSAGTRLVNSPGTAGVAGNFDLVSGSTAINAGTNRFANVVSTDYAGRARQSGGTVDVGAFESGSSAPAPTTTVAPPTTAAPTTAAPTTTPPRPPTTRPPTTGQPTTSRAPSTRPPTTRPATSTTRPSTSGPVATQPPRVPVATVPTTEPATPATSAPATTSVIRPPTTEVAEQAGAPTTTSTSPRSNPTESRPSEPDPSVLVGDGGVTAIAPGTSSTTSPPTTKRVRTQDTGKAPDSRSRTSTADQPPKGTIAVPPPGAGPNATIPTESKPAAADGSLRPTNPSPAERGPGSDEAASDVDDDAPDELALIDDETGPRSVSPVWPLSGVFLTSLFGAWQCTRPSRFVDLR